MIPADKFSQCRVTDTQVDIKACGPLGFFFIQMKGRRDKISKTSVSVFIPTDFYRYMREKFEMNVVLKLRIMTRICCRASPA